MKSEASVKTDKTLKPFRSSSQMVIETCADTSLYYNAMPSGPTTTKTSK